MERRDSVREQDLLDILERTGALITRSHIICTNGAHVRDYIAKDVLFAHVLEASHISASLARLFHADRVETVIAPATGGIALEQLTALHLARMLRRPVYGVYAEKGGLAIRPSFHKFVAGKQTLVLEDTVHTGRSVRRVVEAVRALGGIVVGVGAIVDRGGATREDVGNPPKFRPLVSLKFEAWPDEASCPMCVEGIPVNTEVGHGREFLAKKAQK